MDALVTGFFRPEAVHHAKRRLDGAVVLEQPPGLRNLSWVVLGLAVTCMGFLATATFARKETVPGVIVPDEGLVRVSALQGGVVQGLSVKEGDIVQAGQALARLKLTAATAEGDVGSNLNFSLAEQRAAAVIKASAATDLLVAERAQVSAKIEGLGREVAETGRRISLQEERIALARREVDRAKSIADQGYLSQRDLDARRGNVLSLEQDQASLRATQLEQQREIRDLQARLVAIPIALQSARAEARSTNANIQSQSTQTQAQSNYIVAAPVAGRVVALPVIRGQTVVAGGVVSVVVPSGSRLEVELYAPTKSAGFVRAGQPVKLKYDAYPFQKFGAASGRIVSVSRTSLAPTEIVAPGLELREPVFRVRVALDREDITAYGERIPLQPGEGVSADIVFDRRTLLEWLLDPLYAVGRRQ